MRRRRQRGTHLTGGGSMRYQRQRGLREGEVYHHFWEWSEIVRDLPRTFGLGLAGGALYAIAREASWIVSRAASPLDGCSAWRSSR
jgi:hypothetical protein